MAEAPHRLSIFLCHSSGDKQAVRKLYKRLRADGFDPWLDKENILAGQDWEREIAKAVRTCDVVLVCLSCGSINKKGFVQKEILFALDVADRQPEDTIFLIPLKLEGCELPERLKHLHVVSLYKEGGYERLRKSLQHRAATLNKIIQRPPASSWKLIGALLILLLVTFFLFLNPPSSPAPLEFSFPDNWIQIHNPNDYSIGELEAYLTAYKIKKVRLEKGERALEVKVSDLIGERAPEVKVSDWVSREVAPKQGTTILTRDLITCVESLPFEVPHNSNEFIIWALVITFHRAIFEEAEGKIKVKIVGEKIVQTKLFSVPVVNGKRVIFPIDSPENANIIYGISYKLTSIKDEIVKKENKRFW